jgi:hypothetical protein
MPQQEPTWCDIGAVAESIYVLTKHADLPHDLLVELAGPAIRRLATMGERILTDPHGDSELAASSRWRESQSTAPGTEAERDGGQP